ncbi:hypothetical protein DL764_010874 [Monosporascus ibericus]|uniref:Proteasome component ECM29 n=1 Tax=Monosporascus ibericus TaxID=155417 RepID=A0A4Q4SRY7_9PEZI|nr:hypothetical protein DL764_010874 [Monosporascus ibericus]
MSTSNEGTELRLVSSIRFKLANVSGDEKKLSDALRTQLVPLLEKAGSPHKAVRDAAFQAFISVNNFAKPSGVILPVKALLEQYKQTTSPMVKQLDLSLVKQGVLRLDLQERQGLLPVALKGISKETSPASAAGFFNIFLRLLLDIKLPSRGTSDDLSLRSTIGLSGPPDATYISHWLGRLFLLRQDLALASEDDLDKLLAFSPSGLTRDDIAFLRNNSPHTWRPNAPNSLSLAECKIKAVNFLASGAFTGEERYLPVIFAAGSADSRITFIADDVLKRSAVNLEDGTIITSLFDAHNRLPAAHRIQILRLLSKSVAACTFKEQVVEAVKEDFRLTTGDEAAVLGLEALRLHKALLTFLAWVARNSSGSSDIDRDIGPALVLILKDYILGQGWPQPNPRANQAQFQDELRVRANAYETIGALARGSNFDHKAKDSLLKWLFDSLVSDPSPGIVVHIESALSSMMGLVRPTTLTEQRDLERLLLEYMTLPDRQGIRTARHVAARFANNCLPYSNIKARWIDILALNGGASERRDVLEEGQRGLDPWWATKLHPDDELELPNWEEMTREFLDTSPRAAEGDEMIIDQTSRYTLFPDDRLPAFPITLRFIKQVLFVTRLGDKGCILRKSLVELGDYECLVKLLHAALDGIRDHPDIGAEECVACLAEVLSFAPTDTVIRPLSTRASELLQVMKSNNQKVRQLATKAFGILSPWDEQSASSISKLRGFIESCRDPSPSQSAEYQGSLACLGSHLSHAAYYGKPDGTDALYQVEFLHQTFTAALKSPDLSIRDVSIDVMSQLWTAGLAFPDNGGQLTDILNSLSKLASSNNERAIKAIGRLAIPAFANEFIGDATHVAKILDALLGLSETKRTEVHLTTGEAIAAAIARWDSDAVQLDLDVQPTGSGESDIIRALGKRPSEITATLDKLITDCKTTKPSLLKASGIWLFCVIQYCSNLPEIQARLRECQAAFMRLLAARDELVQETASRGLALVYERGDESLKGDLVKDLVASFTGSKTQLKVDEDTELFDAGALPTGEGKSVTSYKDIISLANEVGDQSLIYKFMALATNAATWTARSAFGRFGLSNILSDAELDPKIYPKLYRYRFDPNANVRRSMDDIWKAVVKDSTAVIDQYFDSIMDDLLKSILDGREWRVREASCAAIAELIYGQPFPQYEKYYTEIWRMTLKVLDDRKESVRKAAVKLCMSLSKTLVTQLQENNSSASARAMVAQVLPFLLSDKGIENSVQEVKVMAITTVLDVVKNGGDVLKSFIPTIITHCLGLLSTVEPEMVNYYYQRADEEDREHFDKLRSNAATQSPIFECVVNCLRFTDEGVMKELAPQLVQTLKSAIGMQTKVGCGEVLSTLALRHSILLPPYNAAFLKAMETQILDRNHEASKAYARSSAYLLRSASPETRDRFSARLADLYFAAEDDARRQKVADAVLAIAKVSPDAFTDLEARLLPFAYLARHDTDEYVAEEFEAVWSQHAGGSHTVKRFVDEIADFVERGLGTSKWALQHGAALAIASTVTALAGATDSNAQFGDAALRRIWPVLDRSLALKTFRGKEKLVAAFPVFVRHSRSLWSSDAAVAAQTKRIALREAKRNNEDYRPHALEALGDFAAAREDLDMYKDVVELVKDHLDREEKAAHSLTELERRTTAAALKAVLTAYNRPKMRSDPAAVLDEIATVVEGARKATAVSRDAWFAGATDLMNTAAAYMSEDQANSGSGVLAIRWLRLIVADEADVVLESQRSGRAKTLLAFVQACKKGVFGPLAEQGALEDVSQKVKSMAESERSLDVQKLLSGVIAEMTNV